MIVKFKPVPSQSIPSLFPVNFMMNPFPCVKDSNSESVQISSNHKNYQRLK